MCIRDRDKIEKTFGKGSIMKMGDDNVQEVEVIPTGSIALNAALGVGGYPKGKMCIRDRAGAIPVKLN